MVSDVGKAFAVPGTKKKRKNKQIVNKIVKKIKKQSKSKSKSEIDDIFSIGKKKAQEETARIVSEKTCPKGHKLNPEKTPHAGYYCDSCRKENLPKGTTLYGCRKCDFDICRSCLKGFDASKFAASMEEKKLSKSTKSETKGVVWIDDGLGGVYDKEGFTGRTTGQGLRIFKGLHSRNKNGGGTPLCPINCDCCF
mmetsp:Transcript_24302/g.36454  ORF Transcript_24302/g.36454 Transcript_24302/m.36454 type:complete len:195 (+) Transcript_24302:64-648(+)